MIEICSNSFIPTVSSENELEFIILLNNMKKLLSTCSICKKLLKKQYEKFGLGHKIEFL